MRLNDLTIGIMNYMLAELPKRGLTGYTVIQNFQPTAQGRPVEPVIVMYCTANKPYGFKKRSSRPGASVVANVRREKQYYEARFKVTAIIPPPDIRDMSALKQGDVVAIAANILNSPDFVSYMKRAECGVLRILDIVNAQIENDQDQNEDNYSFDVIITHSDEFVDDVPVISEFNFSIFKV